MARPRGRPRKNPAPAGQEIKISVPPPVTVEDDPEDDPTPEEIESQEDIEEAAAEAPRRAEIRIYRSHPMGPTRESYTDTVDAASFRTDMLRENYGGGQYRLDYFGVARGNKTKEGWGKLKTRRVLVDTTIPPKHPAAAQALAGGPPVGAPPPAMGASALDQALVGMLINMMQQSQEMSKMQAAMMADHSRVIAAQISELAERGRTPERDPIEMLKTASELLNGRGAGQSPVTMLKELLEVKELLGGEGGQRETNALDVVKEFAPPILDTINRALDRPAPTPAVGPVQAGTPALANVPNAEIQPAQPAALGGITVSMMWQQFAKWVPNFTRWATQNRPPDWVAETMLLEIPEGYHDALLGMLQPETMVEETVSRFPPLAPFRAWLSEVRAEAISMLTASPDDGDDSPDSPD